MNRFEIHHLTAAKQATRMPAARTWDRKSKRPASRQGQGVTRTWRRGAARRRLAAQVKVCVERQGACG